MEPRRRRPLLFAAAFAVGAAGVSPLATWTWVARSDSADLTARLEGAEARAAAAEREARDAANRARRARDQAAELLSYFTDELRDEMAAVGRTDLLEKAARRAEAYFEALPPGDADAGSDWHHAKMLILRGWAHHAQGALAESSEAFAKAVALLEPHAGAAGAEPLMADTYAHALNESTLPLLDAGRLEASRAASSRALAVYRRLAETEPDDPAWAHGAALSLFGIASADHRTGAFEEALAGYGEAVAEAARARAGFPDDVNYLAVEMVCLTNRGQCRMELEDFDGAEADTEAAAGIAERLIEIEPARKKWRKEYASLLNNFGSMLDDAGEHGRAAAFLERSRGIRRELIAFDPANASWRSDLANSEFNRAMNQLAAGDLPAAADAGAACLEQWAVVLRADPTNASAHDRLRRSVGTLADGFRDADAVADAAKLYEAAARLFAELAESEAGREDNLDRQARVLKIAADRREEAGDLASAVDHWRAAARVRQALLSASPADAGRWHDLATASANVGFGYRLSGDPQSLRGALRWYRVAHSINLKRVPPGHGERDIHLAMDAGVIRQLESALGEGGAGEILLPMGSSWRYWDKPERPPAGWQGRGFDDSAWDAGEAQLGYGDGDEATELNFGDDPEHKPMTAYFRTVFEVGDPGEFQTLHLSLVRDDGAVVYLNGREIARDQLPPGPVDAHTPALDFTANEIENDPIWIDVAIPAGEILQAGENLLAVEIHQVEPASSDLSFDLQVTRNAPDIEPWEQIEHLADPNLRQEDGKSILDQIDS